MNTLNPRLSTLKYIFTLVNKFTYFLVCCLLVLSVNAFSQRGIQGIGDRLKGLGNVRTGGGGGGKDSLKRRDRNEDSITIRFHYLDSTRNYLLDSSISDFTRRFPIPATNIYLGNNGTASQSLLFSPLMKPGWDPGFHAYDIYKWTLEKARFFNTTRPYSELNYQLASKAEQMIEVLHTQNIKPGWNIAFQYRLINAPGYFQNQKTNHNNYLVTSWFQSVNKRYNNYFILLGNKLQSGENGGIQDSLLKDPDFKDRFIIPTMIGGTNGSRNFFSSDVGTGNRYNEFSILLRQQYDFGKKDSVVTDSTVIPLFYPRLRFEHTLLYGKYQYEYRDYIADSIYYQDLYNLGSVFGNPTDTVYLKDQWKELTNDFSIYQFPDAKNLHQFFKLGAAYQNLSQLLPLKKTYYNVYGHAEYRNRTRNLKWDLEANGKLYFIGLNAGDYYAYASLQRSTGGKIPGYARLAFENVNRTPSFIYNLNSDFYLPQPSPTSFKKENSTHLSASLYQPSLRLKLSGDYYLMTNYTYVSNYYQLQQYSSLFNVLLVSLEKTIKVGKHWNWHADIYFQQVIGNAPVNLPLIFTRNRFAYEGNLGFKNLDIALGIEARYHTPYKADAYSPVLGHFFYQEDTRIDNPMPDITAYVHFRIKPFKAYFRVENLNTAQVNDNGLGFTNNNLAAPGYPYPGLILRLGVYWSFVN